jgi:trehalose 6-phosphate phosphatase
MDHNPAAGPARTDRLSAAALEAPQDLARTIATAALACGGLLLCTDFDGTLSPIVRDHQEAQPLPQAVEALAWLTRSGAGAGEGARAPVRLAVVTSRDADDLVARLPLGPEAAVVGCAGLERWVDGRTVLDPAAAAFLPALEAAAEALARVVANGRLPGATVERKSCSAVLHIRAVAAASAEAEARELARATADRLGLRLVTGKRALELRPPLDTDKATAVIALHAQRAGDLLCVAGDDLPDVPMLRVAATGGGIAVAVADRETPEVVLQSATVTVEGPWCWGETLSALVGYLRSPAD